MKIIAFGGGTGSGKSTIAYKFVDTYPEIFEVLNFDDYQDQNMNNPHPKIGDMINWDHPDVVIWDKLINDLKALKKGKSIQVLSWSHRDNPDFDNHHNFLPRNINPKPILIIEGYLTLWNNEVRGLYSRSYYFELDFKEMIKRRTKFINSKYQQKVLKPMHKKYVEPTKSLADVVIDINRLNSEQVFDTIKQDLINNKFLMLQV